MLSVLTWNIWFHPQNIIPRTTHICDIINYHQTSVVCLQEVTRNSLIILKKNESLREMYNFFYDPSVIYTYGELMLVKKEFKCSFKSTIFDNTNMGRRINVVYLVDLNIEVYTVHLESVFRNKAKVKKEQFEYLMKLASSSNSDVIITGDMNLEEDDKWADDILYKYDIIDACPDNFKKDYTYDCKKNSHVNRFQSRLDRIFYKDVLETKTLTPQMYNLVGKDTFSVNESNERNKSNKYEKIHPSDHFGIISSFDYDDYL